MDTPLTLRKLIEFCLASAGFYFLLACFGLFWLLHELSGQEWPRWFSAIRKAIRRVMDRHDTEGPTKLGL